MTDNEEMSEKAQLKEFKITSLTQGWRHYEQLLFVQRETIIKRLKEANRDRAAVRDTTQALIGELAGIDMAMDIPRRLLERYEAEMRAVDNSAHEEIIGHGENGRN